MSSRKLLMPMDGGPHSQRALAWYARNFNAPDDELIFAHVTDAPSSGNVTTSDKSGTSEAIAKAKALAAEVAKRCSEMGVKAKIRFLERVSGNPGQSIVDLANEEAVDVIIIGNRGISNVKRTFLGSVSDFVLHHSHRTTIIVPPPKETK